jgi:hypothetical protein
LPPIPLVLVLLTLTGFAARIGRETLRFLVDWIRHSRPASSEPSSEYQIQNSTRNLYLPAVLNSNIRRNAGSNGGRKLESDP